MTPTPNEVLTGPPDEVWENSLNVRAFEALKSENITLYARSFLPAHTIHRLNTEFPGWRLDQRVEQDAKRLSLKRVWYVIVFSTPEQASAYGRDPEPIPT